MSNRDYERVARAIEYLDRHSGRQPALADVAEAAGLSEFHFQRVFRRWAGVSPKRVLQYLTAERAKAALRSGQSVLEATYASGLSGPGRLHDLMLAVDAVTPGEYKAEGNGLTVRYGWHASPFGDCLIAVTARGICALEFVETADRRAAVDRLHLAWPGASIVHAAAATRDVAAHVFAAERAARAASAAPLTLFLRGTNFQIKVWEALLRVPEGSTVSYGDLARAVGRPSAARAVGAAVGRNPIAYVIPCHRVIRSTGAFGEYRWGGERKRAMLAWEGARAAERAG